MARITVEDCLENVDNRFQLVLIASKRAHQLARGYEPLVDADNDKPTVIALREVAEGLVGAEILEEKEETFGFDMDSITDDEYQSLNETTSLMQETPDDSPIAANSVEEAVEGDAQISAVSEAETNEAETVESTETSEPNDGEK